MDELVRVAVFPNEPLADLAVQRLKNAGIAAIFRSNTLAPQVYGTAGEGIDVLVNAEDEARAGELLQTEP